MHVWLTFQQTSDELFLVLTEVSSESFHAPGFRRPRAATTFEHEDVFLRCIVAADLPEPVTRELIATVILTVSHPGRRNRGVELELNQQQIAAMGLEDTGRPAIPASPIVYAENIASIHDFLMQAPTPFAMLSGPEHRFAFINQSYIDLIGQTSQEEVVGKPVRTVLPELEGQPFFRLLDEVFRTQIAYVGVEMPARLRRPHGKGYDDRHFDLIYHPVVGLDGKTSGILVQATDVTQKVLAREVSDQREQQLFRQWAELDAIYRTSPAAMALFCSIELTIIRVNDLQAEWMGSPVGELVGKPITSLPFHSALYVSLLRRVAKGEIIRDYLLRDAFCAEVVPVRTWRVSLSPFRNPAGEIEAICSIALEQVTEQMTGGESPDGCIQAQPEPVR